MIIALGARVKKPGEEMVSRADRAASWCTSPTPDEMDAYERLLGDAMAGDATLFARQDGVEAAWAIVDPILGDVDAGARVRAGHLGPRRRRAPDRRRRRLAARTP